MKIFRFIEYITESLPQQSTVDQLKRIRKLTKGIDIGDKIADMNHQGANIQYIQNPIDTGIESYQDYMASNKELNNSSDYDDSIKKFTPTNKHNYPIKPNKQPTQKTKSAKKAPLGSNGVAGL